MKTTSRSARGSCEAPELDMADGSAVLHDSANDCETEQDPAKAFESHASRTGQVAMQRSFGDIMSSLYIDVPSPYMDTSAREQVVPR